MTVSRQARMLMPLVFDLIDWTGCLSLDLPSTYTALRKVHGRVVADALIFLLLCFFFLAFTSTKGQSPNPILGSAHQRHGGSNERKEKEKIHRVFGKLNWAVGKDREARYI